MAEDQTKATEAGQTAEEAAGNGVDGGLLHPESTGVRPGLQTVSIVCGACVYITVCCLYSNTLIYLCIYCLRLFGITPIKL